MLLLCKGKYKKRFSFAILFKKLSHKFEKKYKKFLIFWIWMLLLKYKRFFKLRARKFHSPEIFSEPVFFLLFELKMLAAQAFYS